MSKDYETVITALSRLSPAELVMILEQVTARLKRHVGPPQADVVDDDEETRRYLPRLPQMIEWGLVIPLEDKLFVRGVEDQPALLLDASRVAYQGETMSINDWAKHITGWKAVNIYEWVVVERVGQTLDDLRQGYLSEHDLE